MATRRTNMGRSNYHRQYSNSEHPALQSTILHDFKTAAPRLGMEGERRGEGGNFNNSGFSNHFNKFSKVIPFRKLQTLILYSSLAFYACAVGLCFIIGSVSCCGIWNLGPEETQQFFSCDAQQFL